MSGNGDVGTQAEIDSRIVEAQLVYCGPEVELIAVAAAGEAVVELHFEMD